MRRDLLQEDKERPLVSTPGQFVKDIDYDCKERKIFWFDINNRFIPSANVDELNVTLIFAGAISIPFLI